MKVIENQINAFFILSHTILTEITTLKRIYHHPTGIYFLGKAHLINKDFKDEAHVVSNSNLTCFRAIVVLCRVILQFEKV
jgi:hypothetical protein